MDARQKVRREARERMRWIEHRFADRDLPQSVLKYYLLLRAIELASISAYIEEYGALPIDADTASAGKHSLGLGDLTRFERELCGVIQEELDWWDAECGSDRNGTGPRVTEEGDLSFWGDSEPGVEAFHSANKQKPM